MNRTVLFSLLSFGLGVFCSLLFFKSNLNSEQMVQLEKINQTKASIVAISENEYLEYTQIKDLKKKYEKADELLGKVLLLLLADTGFRLQKQQVISTQPLLRQEEQNERKALSSISKSQIAFQQKTLSEPSKKDPPKIGSKMNSLQSEEEAREVLTGGILENPKIDMAQGKALNRETARNLEGIYRGQILFLDSRRSSLQVYWNLIPNSSNRKLSGKFELRITGPGTNSHGVSEGSIDKIVRIASDPTGYLVSACGGDCYLQLYYNSPRDQFFGNYYEENEKDKTGVVRTGIVELRK